MTEREYLKCSYVENTLHPRSLLAINRSVNDKNPWLCSNQPRVLQPQLWLFPGLSSKQMSLAVIRGVDSSDIQKLDIGDEEGMKDRSQFVVMEMRNIGAIGMRGGHAIQESQRNWDTKEIKVD